MARSAMRGTAASDRRLGAKMPEKLRNSGWVFGVFALVCGLFEWRTLAGGGSWWLSPVLCAAVLLMVLPFMFTSFMPVFGSTMLSETGVELRLGWRRRHVVWQEITAVEAQRRCGRGGSWYVARVRTLSGKRPVLRGLLGGASAESSNVFWSDLEHVRAVWERTTGHTEPVQIRE